MNDITAVEDNRRILAPASRVYEDHGKVQVRLEMPGVSKGDLEIKAEGNSLTVTGKRQESATHGTWLLKERRRGDFHTIDLERIDAELDNGILTLTLPMKEAAKPRKVEIRG